MSYEKSVRRPIAPRSSLESFTIRRVLRAASVPPELTWWKPDPVVSTNTSTLPVIEENEIPLLSGRRIVLIRREAFDPNQGRLNKKFYLRENGALITESNIDVDEWPLVGASQLGDSGVVVVAEGLKARQALVEAGIPSVATVSPTVGDAALESIVGRQVVLWPDNDARGVRIMTELGAQLQAKGTQVRMVRWVDGPHHADAADFEGDMRDLIDRAQPIDPLLIDQISKLPAIKATPAPLMLKSRRKTWINQPRGQSDE